MEETLRTWKLHFSICDAAYLALLNILVPHGLSLDHVRRGPHHEPSCLPESRLSYGQVENRPLIATSTGCFSPTFAAGGEVRRSDDFQLSNSAYSAVEQLFISDQLPVLELDSGHGESVNSIGINNFEDPTMVPINTAHEWGTNTANEVYLQDDSYSSELTYDFGSGNVLVESFLMPSNAHNSHAEVYRNAPMPSGQANMIKTPSFSNGVVKRAQKRKRTSSITAPLGQQVKKSRGTVACIRCWFSKRKCEGLGDLCRNCVGFNIPPQVCVRERFASAAVFHKWEDKSYGMKLAWQHLSWIRDSKTVEVGHHKNGPSIITVCRQFDTDSSDETSVFWKAKEGWRAIRTTAFGLEDPMEDLSDYVSRCTTFHLQGDIGGLGYVGKILDGIRTQSHDEIVLDEIIELSLSLWTASCLLRTGWTITGQEILGMCVVEDVECPLHGSIPAPRVLQNQLDRNLEAYIAAKERSLLRAIQRKLRKPLADGWHVITTAVILILQVLERDTWRLMYWRKQREERYKWRHPVQPEILIEKNFHLANLLITHMRCAGELPSGTKTHLSRQLDGKEHFTYDESDESSLDGHLIGLLLKRFEVASAEKLAVLSGCI